MYVHVGVHVGALLFLNAKTPYEIARNRAISRETARNRAISRELAHSVSNDIACTLFPSPVCALLLHVQRCISSAQLMFPRSGLNMSRTRGSLIAVQPRQLAGRKPSSAQFGQFAELPLTLRPITVSPDVSDDGSVPFVPIMRKSGVSVTAVVDGSGARMIRKDYPDYERGVAEYRIACQLNADDKANGGTLFVTLMGSCPSAYEGGFAMCFDRAVCSWAQYAHSPRSYKQVLAAAGVRVLASAMLAGVTSAVNRMHTMGWAHNDIKPDNILLELRDGVVRFVLCDYGLTSRHDRMDHPRGTDGYRFLYHQTRILACHSDFWSIGILSAEVLCGSPFIAPWDLHTLGQPASDQVTIDDFVLLKFRAFGVAQAAPMLRHVLVRDPSSKVNGLDPRLAREALGNVAAYVARLEVDEQFSIQGPIKIGRRKRLHDEVGPSERDPPVQAPAGLAAGTAPLPPPAVVEPCPDSECVPAHQLTITKSQKMHMRRNARRLRWQARQAVFSGLAPTVCSTSGSQPALNSVANRER